MLAALAAYAVVHALSWEPEAHQVQAPEMAWNDEDWASSAHSPSIDQDEFDALKLMIWRMHGRAPDPVPEAAPAEPSDPSVLPLRAYRPIGLFRTDERAVLAIDPKDPAHTKRPILLMGAPRDGLLFERYELVGAIARCVVSRGDERWSFDVHTDDFRPSSAPVRVVPQRPLDRTIPNRVDDSDARHRALKFVAFHGDAGDVAGVRITGVRPDSWASRSNLRPGDVIAGIGTESVSTVADFRALIDASPRGTTLSVVRRDAGEPGVLNVGS